MVHITIDIEGDCIFNDFQDMNQLIKYVNDTTNKYIKHFVDIDWKIINDFNEIENDSKIYAIF